MEAITYHLDVFEGPLDLLLHLISKNKVNIYDIPIALILEQYNQALEEMKVRDLNVTSEFVAMSAHLLYIKSKMLLPRYEEEEAEEDPRAQLVQMLLEYQKFKEVSGVLNNRYEIGKDIYVKQQEPLEPDKKYKYVHNKTDLSNAILRMLDRAERKMPPPVSNFSGIVGREVYSVSSKVAFILKRLASAGVASFRGLFKKVETRSEVVATFLAVLELCKSNRVKISDDSEQKITLVGIENGNSGD